MKKQSFIYIILACIFWGTSGVFVHYISPFGISSFQMTFIRSFVFFLCMGIYIFIKEKELFKIDFKQAFLYFLSGVSFYLTAGCYFLSMQLTSVSTAVVLMYTAPIFVMIYSVTFLSEKFTKIKGISLFLMITGCILVSGIIGNLKFNLSGILIGLSSGIAFSAYNITTKIQMKNKFHPLTATFYCFLFATLIGLFSSNPLGVIPIINKSPYSLSLLCIGMGVVTCVFPYILYTLGLKETDAGLVSSLGVIEPMAATLMSVIFLKESLNGYSFLGIILILLAAFLLSRHK